MSSRQPCVLLGVTGCIAAYKSCEILRGLQKADVRVKVVMTEHATRFVDPTTFRALTREPVAVELFDEPGDPIHHISLAQECDVFLIAPCTANVMAKIACGIADDLLSTTALATTAPLIIAPAMNVHMYEAVPTRHNMGTLLSRGVRFVEADEGYQACGDVGRGRLADPAVVVEQTLKVLDEVKGGTDAASRSASSAPAISAEEAARDLEGLRVFVTAGPTVEPIDAVRFISNHSSGKMGYAVARAAARRGACVHLVSGPVSLDAPEGVEVTRVRTACEMLEASKGPFERSDIAVFTAAVADLRPASPSDRKLKKGADDKLLSSIELVENPDILATLAGGKTSRQCVVGFAAETDDVVANARVKLERKNADLIVANEVGDGRAFGTDDNKACIVSSEGVLDVALMSKDALADVVLDNALRVVKGR